MDFVRPSELALHGNVAENWRRFKQRLMLYLEATEKATKPDKLKVAILLNFIGEEALEVFNKFHLKEDEAENFDLVINKFDDFCEPKKNVIFERFKFFSATQKDGESIDSFITELKGLSTSCEFESQKNSLIRDRIVYGIQDKALQERLLREPNLTLLKAIEMCKTNEISKQQIKIMQNNQNICQIRKYEKKHSPKQNQESEKEFKCQRCGKSHRAKNCPAWDKRCSKCKKMNHFAAFCKSSAIRSLNDETEETVWSIHEAKVVHTLEWKKSIIVNGKEICFKLDSGAEVNVLPYTFTRQMKGLEIFQTNRKLTSYTGHEIKIKGIATLNCKTKNKTESLEFFIADGYYQPILGIEAIEKLSLIKKCDAVHTEQNNSAKEILNRYKNIFEGIGRLPIEHKIRLKENATPVIAPSRKIPFSIREKVKAELERMEKLDIIEKVEEPSEWTHPIVVVQKPSGDVRICMDPRELNKYVQRERYILPTAETIFSELKGATVFSVFDASSAFWQVPLDKESTNLCTIATPFGRFRFKRLPYGLNSASEVFQRCINNILSGLQGTACYMDDILIYGSTMEEHNRNLETVLRRLEENNVKLNAKKQQIAVDKVNFLGHIISRDGIAIQASRAEAIQKLKRPENKTEVQRFLGMVTYLGKFIPNLSDKTAPLRKLISNKSEWKFGGEENDCFEKLKNMVSNAPILTFFDPTKPITISSDASQYGISTVLMQGGQAIEYASFSLNATQRKYAQIEKELLAIVFGCERFQYYIWGNDVIVEADHKPLLSIFTPGKNMFVADHLSRDPLKDEVDTSYLEGQTESVHMLLVTTDEKIKRLQKETHGDHTLIQLIEYAKNGWPKYKTMVCDEAKPYWQFQDEIHVSDGIVYKGNCIMVPSTLRKEILQVVHSSHQGIAASKEKARSAFYWPGMITQVENEVEKCRTCQEYSRKNPEESRIAHEIPEFPWEKIAVDFMEKYEFKHQTSSPKYPRSNGQVERTIQTIKGLIIKAVKSGRDPNLALMEFNNTPKYDLPSPTQMLMGRSVRTLSTYTRQQLKPLFDTTKNYQKLRDHQQKYAGSPKRILRPLEVGDNIMLQERHRKWVPATVTAKHETPRSYMVKTPSGSEYRRNRSHLRPRKFSVEDSAPTSQSPSIPGSQAGTAMDDNIQDHGRPTSENRRAYDPRENVAKKGEESSTSPSVRTRSSRTDKNRMPSSDYKLYAANGTEIVTYGTKVRNLDIGLRRQFQWPFVIANTNRAIIGADFLNNFGLIIDIKNKRLIDGITNLSIRGVIQSISDIGNISTLNSSSKVSAILTKYPNLCRPPSDFVEAKHSVKHYIPTRGQPIHSKARRLDSQRLTIAKAEFQYMLNNGIIRPSNSPWASPLHLVSKKDESLRPCGDYRRLNAVTLPDRYPIPRLDDFHHILKGTRVYSKIDLCKAFYQIPIAEEDKPKTAIITPFGLFEFNVMSFGLRNATATFQRFMHEVLRNLDFAFVYLDDILVASKTEEEHYSHLETLFSRLNSYGLRINLSKSKFLVQEIDFLGYLITSHDASDRAVGSVLQQLDNNNWKPIAFFSKKLNPAQCNYSTYDRELLAIYLSIKFFKHLLEAREFTILTDHKPLIYAFKQKNEKASPRQLRHLQYISQFSTDIKYIKGTDNIVADALSRVDAITTIDYEEIAKEQTGDSELQNLISKNTSLKFKQCPLQSGNLLWGDVSTNNIRPFIPIKFRMMVFRNFHELSHPGIKATTKQLTSRFIWPNMNKDIRKWARACVNCQKCKVSIHTKSEIGKYQEVDERFSVVHIDLIGALPPSNGNIYCLTCIDRFGAPHTVISDQGKQFTSQLFKDLTTLCGIKLRHSTAYHPQCNRKIERLHRTIKTAIRAHNSIKWTETLPTVLLGLRAAINKDNNHSLSQMVYGKTIRLPGEFFDASKHHLHAEEFVQQLQKQMELLKPLNEKHHSKTKVFVHKDLKTCSHIFIRTDRVKKPLEAPYEGPFPVLDRTDKYFTLKVKGRNVTISIDRLRPAYLLADSDNVISEHPTATRPIVSGALPSTSSQQNPDPPDVEKYTEFQGTGSAPDLPRTRSGRIIKKPLWCRILNLRKMETENKPSDTTEICKASVQLERVGKPQPADRVATNSSAGIQDCRNILLFVMDKNTGLRFLVDSGADISIIPPKDKNRMLISDYKPYAANGTEIVTYGTKVSNLDFGLRRQFQWPFVIVNTNRAILRADFLNNFGLVIDIKNKRLIDGITNFSIRGAIQSISDMGNISTLNSSSKVSAILTKYPNLCRPQSDFVEAKHSVKHYIPTRGQPIHSKACRLDSQRLTLAKAEFQYMLNNGIIRPSNSPWASPLHLVSKKDESLRPCGDYRRLNAVTLPDRYPIPRLDDFHHILKGTRVYSKIDLCKAFYQIPIAEEDKPKTAIITPFGLFEFNVMSFGLRNATATFQRFMHEVLRNLDFAFVYLDDILVASETEEEHYSHLGTLFSRLNSYGLRINLSKSKFLVQEIDFLGYLITSHGVKPLPKKVKAILEYKKPKKFKNYAYFWHLLEAREFTILTDHKPLIYAFKQKKKNEKASPRQLRHLQYISQFTTDIKYIKGTDNIVADALSRVDAITTIDYEENAKEQTGDSELQNLISKNTSLKFKQFPLHSGKLLWCDVSTNNIRPLIPIKFRMMVFRNFNELSHPGIKATTKQLTSRFIWPNMNKYIRKWAQACVNCQKCKVSIHTKSEIGKYQEVDERFSVVNIDLIDPLPPSNGNIYCLTCIDRYTSWMEVVPLPDMKSETVARVFNENWIVRFGAPHTVISDQGKQFTSQLFKDLTKLCERKQQWTITINTNPSLTCNNSSSCERPSSNLSDHKANESRNVLAPEVVLLEEGSASADLGRRLGPGDGHAGRRASLGAARRPPRAGGSLGIFSSASCTAVSSALNNESPLALDISMDLVFSIVETPHYQKNHHPG
ncbi:hypothetical protein LAZ67_3004985, partial [Cordylochernes scorpioides]